MSNHPFGALDGISLIALLGTIRPEFKVMVNMVLNHISAMRPNFIAVDALASDDPAKKNSPSSFMSLYLSSSSGIIGSPTDILIVV